MITYEEALAGSAFRSPGQLISPLSDACPGRRRRAQRSVIQKPRSIRDLAAKVREALNWPRLITDRKTQNRGFHARIAP